MRIIEQPDDGIHGNPTLLGVEFDNAQDAIGLIRRLGAYANHTDSLERTVLFADEPEEVLHVQQQLLQTVAEHNPAEGFGFIVDNPITGRIIRAASKLDDQELEALARPRTQNLASLDQLAGFMFESANMVENPTVIRKPHRRHTFKLFR